MHPKKLIIPFLGLVLLFSFSILGADYITKNKSIVSQKSKSSYEDLLKEGDVIFQTSSSGQSLAIQISTGSKYSHCGILFKENGQWMVFEAVQPVRKTTLKEFIDRGDDNMFCVTRLNSTALNSDQIANMKSQFNEIEGKNYDIYFNWSDKEWYCSELVWKLYHEIGIDISPMEKFGDFELNHPVVKEIVKKRFPKGAPLDETVITPKGIHNSPKMHEIFSNYNDQVKKM